MGRWIWATVSQRSAIIANPCPTPPVMSSATSWMSSRGWEVVDKRQWLAIFGADCPVKEGDCNRLWVSCGTNETMEAEDERQIESRPIRALTIRN